MVGRLGKGAEKEFVVLCEGSDAAIELVITRLEKVEAGVELCRSNCFVVYSNRFLQEAVKENDLEGIEAVEANKVVSIGVCEEDTSQIAKGAVEVACDAADIRWEGSRCVDANEWADANEWEKNRWEGDLWEDTADEWVDASSDESSGALLSEQLVNNCASGEAPVRYQERFRRIVALTVVLEWRVVSTLLVRILFRALPLIALCIFVVFVFVFLFVVVLFLP